jgi:hypothetical protein
MDPNTQDPHSGSPADVQDPIGLILELAGICRDAWPAVDAGLRESGVPLCKVEDPGPPGNTDEPADPAGPAPGASTTVDWEVDENVYKKRFNDYRSEADRKITRLSQYEQAVQDFQTGDPAEMRRAAAILGIADHLEIEDPAPPVYDDPNEELRAQYAKLEEEFQGLRGELTAKEQKDKEAAEIKEVQRRLDDLKLTDEDDRNTVLGRAFTLPMGEDGLPDVKAAFEAIVARDRKHGRAWKATKTAAPGSIAPGSTATQQKDIADMTRKDGSLTQEGLDYLAAKYEDRVA